VDNPLFGSNGAAFIFAPQKGADISAVKYLDNGLKHFYGICSQINNSVKQNLLGAGAAGGLGYGTSFFLGASLKSGIDLILKYSNIEKFMPETDLVITGEGALDRQTLQGKLIKGVCQMAKKYDKPVIAICGALDLNSDEFTVLGLKAAFSIAQGPGSLNDALLNTEKNLALTAFNIAQMLK
jgi:glycerate kinase